MRYAAVIAALVALMVVPAVASAESAPPYECDDQFGQCGTPEQSGGGCGCGCGSILVNNTDLGDTYQYADDYDDDGVEDFYDNCPYAPNRDQGNGDGDVSGDACDNCIAVGNEMQSDIDGDAIGDECDTDIDGDDVANAADNCPNVANALVAGEQADTDGDGIGDACDTDDDGDGVADLEDNCPLIANPEQGVITDDGGCYADMDGDGVWDHQDNCVAVQNAEQLDTDTDGLGNECDTDMDGDGELNAMDNCPLVAQDTQIDLDRDGVGEECDDHYCYVVMGDAENCLDPQASFRVYSPSLQNVETGEPVRLRLFANRENAPIEYRWSVIQAPSGSGATVANPYGSVRLSTPYEYHYAENDVATFTPDEPGEYVLRLEGTQVWEDAMSGNLGETSEAVAFLVVEGDSMNAGCSAAPGAPAAGSLGLLALLGLFFARRFGK